MIHRLRVGHFDRDAMAKFQRVLLKSLTKEDLDPVVSQCEGHYDGNSILVGGHKILIKDGYLDCPWKTPHLNAAVVEFIKRLHAKSNCVVYEKLLLGELKMEDLD